MRIESIELLRYGHFSGQQLQFPQQEHDFHLIVGGNEAGKSTLRQAFHDLLFGIPMNTSMAFLHGGPELALAAVLQGESGELAMGRRRRRDGGLVDAAGQKLAPESLARCLGGVTEAFYERMFGLDHRRLEQGSRAMLQAGDDVDSVLFQAAAGLAALNGVLASLREEAAGLFTPHHSRNRAWYAASDRYKAADKAVREASVRPTRWLEAQRESRRLDDVFTQARDDCSRLRARLRELERLRRLAPLLAQIREYEATLGKPQMESVAQTPLLLLEADIQMLEASRLKVAGHGVEIDQCEAQIQLLHEQLDGVRRQLGQHPEAGQGAEAAPLPAQPLRHEIAQLLNEGRALQARREAAARTREARMAEVDELRARIQALPVMPVADSLRRALDAATAAGDLTTALAALQHRAEQEETELKRRLAALQRPGLSGPPELETLQSMTPWPTEALLEQVQERREVRAALEAADKRVDDARLALQAGRLQLEQFRRSHQAVSRDEVMAARRERDTLWRHLADGGTLTGHEGERYASLVLRADVLADRHLEAVDDAARLQGMEHDCERLEAAARGLEALQTTAAARVETQGQRWSEACAQRGLPAFTPAELQGWLPAREAALRAHDQLLGTRAELAALQARHRALLHDLLAALPAEAGGSSAQGETASSLPLACDAARILLQQADAASARREALSEQLQRLELLLPGIEQECGREAAAYTDWLERRQAALARAGLPPGADAAYVEAALALFAEADTLLGRLRGQQAERDRLKAELHSFRQAVMQLAGRLGCADAGPGMAETLLRRWVAELGPLRAAERDREQARRQLATLSTRLLEEADGRDRAQVEAELAQVDFSTLAGEAEALGVQIEEAEHQRDHLALEREQARTALEAISGGDDAAQAEARRQEALADMGEVAERYAQVYAQYRLLEHITERYRERSQGPLLARAGQLFSALTLGAHEGLEVDGDAATLWARRAGGRLAPLEGLSDGTRDQLYLALRLAALELYLDSAEAMPFIADDLFVNYDDGRALAGLRQLTEVSRRTQVIFLTHHAHMVELARAHLADRVNVIELPVQGGRSGNQGNGGADGHEG